MWHTCVQVLPKRADRHVVGNRVLSRQTGQLGALFVADRFDLPSALLVTRQRPPLDGKQVASPAKEQPLVRQTQIRNILILQGRLYRLSADRRTGQERSAHLDVIQVHLCAL